MKERKVKYLAIYKSFINSNHIYEYNDLFSLKNEVEEFKLHNINVQKYNDLLIRIEKFIKDLD